MHTPRSRQWPCFFYLYAHASLHSCGQTRMYACLSTGIYACAYPSRLIHVNAYVHTHRDKHDVHWCACLCVCACTWNGKHNLPIQPVLRGDASKQKAYIFSMNSHWPPDRNTWHLDAPETPAETMRRSTQIHRMILPRR